MPNPTEQPYWQGFFSERQLKEIAISRLYWEQMRGEPHNDPLRMIISKMAELLNAYGPQTPTEHTVKMKEIYPAECGNVTDAQADLLGKSGL